MDRGVNSLQDATLHCKFSVSVTRNCPNVLVSAYPACLDHVASNWSFMLTDCDSYNSNTIVVNFFYRTFVWVLKVVPLFLLRYI